MKKKTRMTGGIGLAVFVAAAVWMLNSSTRNDDLPNAPMVEDAVVLAATSCATPPISPGTQLEINARETHVAVKKVVTLEESNTLSEVLLQAGLSQREAHAASEFLQEVYQSRILKVSQALSLFIGEHDASEGGPSLMRLELVPEINRLVSVEHLADGSFATRTSSIRHTRNLMSSAGKIQSSLYDATRTAEVPTAILIQTYRILSYAPDFQRDMRDGDTFQLASEMFEDSLALGHHPSDLIYATIGSSGRKLCILRCTASDGYTGFFDDKGVSIETSMMKTSVDVGIPGNPGANTTRTTSERAAMIGPTRIVFLAAPSPGCAGSVR